MSEEKIIVSKLPEGWQQFMSEVHEHSLKTKVREATDFINISRPTRQAAFSCPIVLDALEPELIAKMLVPCTSKTGTAGLDPNIALNLPASVAAVILQTALDTHTCEPENVLQWFEPNDRVLHLDTQSLWSFETGSEYWVATKVEVETSRNRAHMQRVLEVGRETGLLTSTNVITGVGFTALREYLPGEMLDLAMNAVRNESERRRVNKEPSMSNEEHDAVWLGVVTPEELVKYVPLDHIYAGVIVPMAERNEFVDKPEPAAVSNTEPSPEVTVNSESDEDVDEALDSLAAPPKTEDDSPKA